MDSQNRPASQAVGGEGGFGGEKADAISRELQSLKRMPTATATMTQLTVVHGRVTQIAPARGAPITFPAGRWRFARMLAHAAAGVPNVDRNNLLSTADAKALMKEYDAMVRNK